MSLTPLICDAGSGGTEDRLPGLGNQRRQDRPDIGVHMVRRVKRTHLVLIIEEGDDAGIAGVLGRGAGDRVEH